MPSALDLVRKLEHRLDQRWFTQMGIDDAYYEGDHQLSFATSQFKEAFGSLFAAIADNWMPIVVDSSAERLHVQGFRFGKNQQADDDAWAIWQANGLDAEAGMLHTEAIKLGEAYWLIEPGAGDEPPRVTAEDPSQVIVMRAAGDRRKRAAALKKWADEDGFAYANLYLPDQVIKFRSAVKLSNSSGHGARINWVPRQDDPGGPHNLGVVPVVPLPNNPSLTRGGRSDIAPVRPLQNAINKLLSDMLIGAEYQAFPQRVLLGAEVPRDANGQPVRAAELQASKSRLWVFENENAKVAEFKAADLENYVNARRHLVEHLTAQSKTPPHYVTGKMVNVTGDALKAAETGHTSKCESKTVYFGEGHEEMARLSLISTGRPERELRGDTETLWKDVETRSFGELVDGLLKLSKLGVPTEMLLEKAGWSPQEIARAKAMQEADSLLAGALNAVEDDEPAPKPEPVAA